ncbi:hypothetical protein JMUB6875_50460 [Nocardia sp. JMUB6875]
MKMPPTCSVFTTFAASAWPVTPTVSSWASFCRSVNCDRYMAPQSPCVGVVVGADVVLLGAPVLVEADSLDEFEPLEQAVSVSAVTATTIPGTRRMPRR